MKKLVVISGIAALVLAISGVWGPTGKVLAASAINVPTPTYPTISAGIAAASSGDSVLVAAGAYNERITLKDGVKLIGAGASVTTINGGANGTVVTAINLGSATKLDGFTITNGNSNLGGGMFNRNASLTVVNCIFSSNTGDIGAGMYNVNSSSLTITNCTFSSNIAILSGGGMTNDGSSPIVTKCTFSNNTATWGGGMYNYSSSPIVGNCIFFNNAVSQDGGGMFNGSSSPTVTNCVFYKNTAVIAGGGFFGDHSSTTIITNCTSYNNVAGDGKGLYNFLGDFASLSVTNCIFWDGGGEISETGSSLVVKYCDVEGGYTGTGNINSDPSFVNAVGGDFHLRLSSSCIDVGNNNAPSLPSVDFEGDPRIVDGNGDGVAIVDMGVDEVFIPVTLKIFKFEDKNWNKVKDPTEPVLPGWTFTITGPNGYNSSSVTDASGLITLTNLMPGSYAVVETPKPGGWVPTNGAGTRFVTLPPGGMATLEFGNEIIPATPASSNWSIGLLVGGLMGAVALFVLRNRKSHQQV